MTNTPAKQVFAIFKNVGLSRMIFIADTTLLR